MDRPTPEEKISSPLPAEHDASGIPRVFTAWHQFLAQSLLKTRAPGLGVHCFVKLGSLPLEADIIILQLDENANLDEFAQYFGFLVPCLRRYLILEYKSPDDRLTYDDFDTVRAYAMLCKRSYQAEQDADIAVAMLYSRTSADFFDRCARDGYHFAETQPGVRSSSPLPLSFHALDLVAIGEQQPEHPINLLSARRRAYGAKGAPSNLGPFSVLYEEVFFRELKKMSQLHVPGYQELLTDAERLNALVLARCSAEERVRGLAPEDRLRGLAPEDRLRDLSAIERDRLLELLLKQAGR